MMTNKKCKNNEFLEKMMFFKEEIRECDKHEIIVNISSMLGNNPCDLCKAEEIFNKIKYDIAKFIVNHEFQNKEIANENISIWLEEKTSPAGINQLSKIIDEYLK